MHILLTDVLACPRCGPGFGLVLLADRLDARRVLEGSLGCANCRERYAVRGGTADLRPGAGVALPALRSAAAVPEPAASGAGELAPEEARSAALRLAALLGVTEGAGIVLLVGWSAGIAAEVAIRLESVEVAAAGGEPGADGGGAPPGPVSRVVVPERLPFGTRTLRGVALAGAPTEMLLEEAVRVLSPMHRLVLERAGPDARSRVEAAGLEVLAEEGGTLVALKREAPDPPKLHQLV